ncbi:hypothetical protein [Fodinibius saliphilus]|uniref:hypothetical protein n=1 Tax=Fodinibius saliphilus TaxID=1920650 RepID=UPI001109EC43|nr:hypothetical protein [Fodinibius saliphilus]
MLKRILLFLSKKQFREVLLRESEARYKFFTYFSIILIGSFCIGYFLASYYDFNVRENVVNVNSFLLFVNIFFAINYLLLDFYPVYKVNPFLFPNYYPLGKYSKALVVVFVSSINYYSLFVFCMYIQFVVFSNFFGVVELSSSLLFVFCGYLINRTIKNITEYEVPKGKLLFTVVLLLLASYCTYIYYFHFNSLLGIILLITFFCSLFVCFTYSEVDKKVKIQSTLRLFKCTSNFYWNILSNSNLSSTYLYGFFFKILWLAVAGLNLVSGKTTEVSAVTWQFASPLLLLLYTGLNFFGYNKELFFTHLICEEKSKNIVEVYFKSMGILLCIDAFIFGSFIIITGFLSWYNVLFYINNFIILTVVSFWFALYRPQFTDNFLFFNFSFLKERSNDFNPWGVSALVITSFIVYQMRQTSYMLEGSLLLILVSVISLYFAQIKISTISKYAYQKLRGV